MSFKKILFTLIAALLFAGVAWYWMGQRPQAVVEQSQTRRTEMPAVVFSENSIEEATNAQAAQPPEQVFSQKDLEAAAKKPLPDSEKLFKLE